VRQILERGTGARFLLKIADSAIRTRNEDKEGFLVSIIIVVFRDRNELKAVLDSVLKSKTAQVEVIVIDGGSDDGSVELLHQFGSAVDHWVSEPDLGLYDAMNKGIACAHGRFVYHINAGDRLVYLPVREIVEADAEHFDVISFGVSVDGKNSYRPSAGWRLRINNTLHHQGTFYRRSQFPGYRLNFKVFADFDANQRLALQGARMKLYDHVVAIHSSGGLSNQGINGSELFRVVASNYGRAYVPLTWLDCKFRGLKQRLEKLLSVS
jgi:glycosyltransferase involved in cell wall biosynthesis